MNLSATLLKVSIFILSFSSVSLISWALIPPALDRYNLIQRKRANRAARDLDNLFLRMENKKLLFLFILSPFILATAGYIIFQNFIATAVGGAVGFAIPTLIIKQWELQRKRKFQFQLVDSLMILSGSLKAGLSLLQAFETVTEEMPPPIAQEFSLVIRENRMGVPLEDCLEHLKRRMQLEDLDLVITAILVARETGGDLTQTFSQLVSTIRERDKLHGRVKALTVQARIQGLIMEILPVAFAIFIYKMNPRLLENMLQDKLGQILLMWAVVSEILGVFFIRKFSKVEV